MRRIGVRDLGRNCPADLDLSKYSEVTMKGSNWLARVFEWNQQVIEAAETPFARLAIFVLPILSPVVPALMTALHIHKLMQEIFVNQIFAEISVTLSAIVGVVLELIGYVGAVLFIQAIYKWIQTRKSEYFLPMVINGMAYIFYLVAMYMINYQLGIYFNTPDIMNQIVGLLSFITVPTGLLAANHLSQKQLTSDEYTIRQERREDSLKKQALKRGINIFAPQPLEREEKHPRESKRRSASHFAPQITALLDSTWEREKRVMMPSEITPKLKGLTQTHDKAKGFISEHTKKWMAQKGIETKTAPPNKLTF